MSELIQNLESMKQERSEIQEEINQSEKHKTDIEENLEALSHRLKELNKKKKKKSELREEYDSNIQELSTAFSKILESSQTLLHVAKKESNTLEKKKEKVMSEVPQVNTGSPDTQPSHKSSEHNEGEQNHEKVEEPEGE